MVQYLVAYVATAVVFLGIDFLWLNFASTNIYRPRLGNLLLDSPNIPVAGLFYLVYSAAIVVLAVVPAQNHSSAAVALGLGLVLGAAAYGTYDITNLSTLRGWSVTVTIVDIMWGMALTGVAATAGYFAARAVGSN